MNIITQSAASRAARDVPRRELPVIDVGDVIAGDPDAPARLADQWREVWETIGFMCIVNHGVPQAQIDGMFAASKQFHDLPEELKQTVPLNTDHRGYMGIRTDHLEQGEMEDNRKPSISQAFFTATEYPDDHPLVVAGTQFYGPNRWLAEDAVPGFRETTLAYMDTVTELGKQLLPIWALALELPADYFAPHFDTPYTYFRNATYPPLPEHRDAEMGIHAHRDTGFMTFLPPAIEEGLQVLDEDGNWFWPEMPDDAMVVNLGQFATRWTNDRFKATTHRVVPPLENDRYAIPVFVNPDFEARNETLSTCTSPDNPPKYPVQSYREWFGWYMSNTFDVYNKSKQPDGGEDCGEATFHGGRPIGAVDKHQTEATMGACAEKPTPGAAFPCTGALIPRHSLRLGVPGKIFRNDPMKISTDRILTTHVGSLPRPEDLLEMLRQEDRGEPVDAAALHARTAEAVKDVVADQVAAGIDVVSDGEMSKISYHVYARHRLAGLEATDGTGVVGRPAPADFNDFPEMLEAFGKGGTELMTATVCEGPVSYDDHGPLDRDIANLKAAAAAAPPTDMFMNTVSPGCLSTYVPNRHYPDRDAYREALIEGLRPEYNAIHEAGIVLQLDCPDLAGARHTDYQAMDEAEFLADAEKSVEALNAATSDIPPEAMRMHICWLNYPGPHTHDIPLKKLLGILAKARPQAILFEGANPRHAHEWEDIKDAGLPDDKVLIPGVIDSTSNFVEHPQLIAQRICQYADIVGRERVLAGSDCGFGTYAGRKGVFPSVVLGKFRAMAEGAQMATDRLWG